MHTNFKSLLFIGFCLSVVLLLHSCQAGRFVVYNFADIHDDKKFPSRPLTRDTVPFQFYARPKERAPRTITRKEKEIAFDQFLEKSKTVAFLIIKNDTIQYERYFKGYDRSGIVPSFSVAKSVTSILIGCAIEDGYISGVEEPVTNYIPELRENGFDKVTIRHLLQMTSGIKFSESYVNPFGQAASFYYGNNLREKTTAIKLKSEPGTAFKYQSGNTQLLGLVLERALKDKTITQYLQEKLWTPLGMEYDASWSIDRKQDGLEKTFCCINAAAIDYAKIGRLFQNKGNWNGQQLVPEEWVKTSTTAEVKDGSAARYQYQWWLISEEGDYMAQGILGQYIYVHPEKNMVIVRLGKKNGNVGWRQVFTSLASAY
ncbi:MAG: serine hydrolase [Saprospiraceae bacterium]|nr:serine hydrolase [Candidatus Opimibacter iunctus]